MPRTPSYWAAHVAMFSVAIIYGLNYFVLKRVFVEVSPFAMLAIRGISGWLFFGLIGALIVREKIDRRDLWRFALCGLFGIALNQLFFLWGMSKTVEVNASVIMIITPVFVFLIAFFLKEETLTWIKVGGLMLSFAGAVALSLGGRTLNFSTDTVVGDLMITTNAASYAAYLVLVRPLSQKYNTYTLFMGIFTFGCMVSVPVGLPDLIALQWKDLSSTALLGTIYVVIFVTFLTYGLNAWALKRVPASQVGIYIYLQPVLVTVLTPLLYTEALSVEKLLYTALVLTGVFLVTRKKNSRKPI